MRARVLVLLAACFGCRPDVDDAVDVARVVPSAVSSPQAWGLFDQSVAHGYVPGPAPIEVAFSHAEQLAALKFYGPAPFVLEVRGKADNDLGFGRIDLAALGSGWHVVPTSTAVSTEAVRLRFEPVGAGAAAVPEIELWAQAPSTPTTKLDLTDAVLPNGFVVASASTKSDDISAGNCAVFAMPLPTAPSQLRRAFVTYRGTGVSLPVVLRQLINGGEPVGGMWLEVRTVRRPLSRKSIRGRSSPARTR